jgi:hypothetical protein
MTCLLITFGIVPAQAIRLAGQPAGARLTQR